jgi:hypothetical protein
MASKKDLIEESTQLLEVLYGQKKEADEIIGTPDKLREKIMSFISVQLQELSKKELLTSLIDAELIGKILLHELSTDELMSLRTNLSISKNTNIDSLLAPFKPTAGSSTALLPPPVTKEEDNDDVLKKLTPEGRGAFNKLMLILEASMKPSERKVNGEYKQEEKE